MRSSTLITASLLCSLSWISVSGSESQTVKVQPGQDVTLMCSNISTNPTQTDWFRVVNNIKASCISSMCTSDGDALYCDGIKNGKFIMTSNSSVVFLHIKRVDLFDSGLYFCGFYIKALTVITPATYLIVQGDDASDDKVDLNTQNEPEGMTNLMTKILGGLTVLLTVVNIALALKIRTLQKALKEEAQPDRNKNHGSDDLNYAALSFQAKPKRKRTPPSEREVEPNVVYAATR